MLSSNNLLNLSKLPEDTAKLVSTAVAAVAAASTAQSSVPSVLASAEAPGHTSVAPTAAPMPMADDEDELNALGLTNQESTIKKPSAKAKVKRTRQEMLQDEIQRLVEEWNQLVGLASQFPTAPTLTQVGRLDRMLSKKIAGLKESFDFEQSTSLSNIAKKLDVFRMALKAATAYMTGTAATRKKSSDEFFSKMELLHSDVPEVIAVLPQTARNSYEEIQQTKVLESEDWLRLQQIFSADSLAKSSTDPTVLMEKLLAKLVKEISAVPDEMDKKIAEVGLSASNILRVVCHSAPPDIAGAAAAIAACFSLRPLPGQQTLEEPLGLLLSSSQQPIYRVIHEHAVGTLLLRAATAENQKLVSRHDAQVSLGECQVFFDKTHGEGVAVSFLEAGDEANQSNFHNLMLEIDEKAGLILHLCDKDGLGKNRGKEALDSFVVLAEVCLEKLVQSLIDMVKGMAQIFQDDSPVDPQNSSWDSIKHADTKFFVQHLAFFCKDGNCSKLISAAFKASLLDEQDPLFKKFMNGGYLLNWVTWAQDFLLLASLTWVTWVMRHVTSYRQVISSSSHTTTLQNQAISMKCKSIFGYPVTPRNYPIIASCDNVVFCF